MSIAQDETLQAQILKRLNDLDSEKQQLLQLINDITDNRRTGEEQPFLTPKNPARPVTASHGPAPLPTSNPFDSIAPLEDMDTENDATDMTTDTTTTGATTKLTKTVNNNNNKTNNSTLTNRPSAQQRRLIGTLHIDNKELKDPQGLLKELLTVTPDGFTAKNRKQELIIQPRTHDDYSKLLKKIDDLRLDNSPTSKFTIHYHHHRTTTEPRTKLVIRGLSSNASPNDIIDEIKAYDIIIHHCSEMKKRQDDQTLQGLGLYIIEVNRRDVDDIKQRLTRLLQHTVTIQDYIPNDRVPQCTNCQQLFHTKSYCHRPAVCAKCSLHHPTNSCNNSLIKCANCTENHPSYWPTCPVILKARQDRLKQLTKSLTKTQTPLQTALTPNHLSNSLDLTEHTSKGTNKYHTPTSSHLKNNHHPHHHHPLHRQ